MAEIIRALPALDGLDVQVRLLDARLHWFHFPTAPGDIQIAVNRAEIALLVAETCAIHIRPVWEMSYGNEDEPADGPVV